MSKAVESSKLLTVAQAAKILKLSGARVRALRAEGRIPATKFGWAWMVNGADLPGVQIDKAGRPKRETL